jgi:methionyl-tRNA synthetase
VQFTDFLVEAGHRAPYRQAGGDLVDRQGAVWVIAEANRFINRVRPWELARAERDGDARAGHQLEAVLSALFAACLALGVQLAPFLPDAAARIAAQCTPRDASLPPAAPVFRRLGSVG